MGATYSSHNRIFLLLLILFLLEMLLLPSALQLTYAGSGQNQEHILTYTSGRLTWDAQTQTTSDGSAQLNLFDAAYANVRAENNDRVIAPGTEKENRVRLKNESGRTVSYTAVLYFNRSSTQLPVQPSLSGNSFIDTDQYSLPTDVEPSSVVRAVTGAVSSGAIADFQLEWFWAFEDETDTADRDRIDTYLGNKAADGAADDAALGFYLVVHDGGEITPAPSTGESTALRGYIVLLCISGGMSLFLALTGRRRRHGA